METFEETLVGLHKYGNSNSIKKLFDGPKRRELLLTVDMMEEDINKLKNDLEAHPKDDEIVWVDDNLKRVMCFLMTEVYDNEFKNFCKMYATLVSNWSMITNNTNLQNTCNAINNIFEFSDCISESIEILRLLNRQFRDLKGFMPPALDLSKHYLLSLQEGMNKK